MTGEHEGEDVADLKKISFQSHYSVSAQTISLSESPELPCPWLARTRDVNKSLRVWMLSVASAPISSLFSKMALCIN